MTRILLIDDSEQMRRMLRRILEGAGYEVIEAAEGREGARLFSERRPELVITDIIMPDQEGIETIMELRQRQPDVKIIAISGSVHIGRIDFLAMAKQLGAAASLQKPIRAAELIQAVEELTAKPPSSGHPQ